LEMSLTILKETLASFSFIYQCGCKENLGSLYSC
jgi:hypothetical protein